MVVTRYRIDVATAILHLNANLHNNNEREIILKKILTIFEKPAVLTIEHFTALDMKQ